VASDEANPSAGFSCDEPQHKSGRANEVTCIGVESGILVGGRRWAGREL
jgi:hypothetical protein